MLAENPIVEYTIFQALIRVFEHTEEGYSKYDITNEIYSQMMMSGDLELYQVNKVEIGAMIDSLLHEMVRREGITANHPAWGTPQYFKGPSFNESYFQVMDHYFVDPNLVDSSQKGRCHICVGTKHGKNEFIRYFDLQESLKVCTGCREDLELLLCFNHRDIAAWFAGRYDYTHDYRLVIEYALKIELS